MITRQQKCYLCYEETNESQHFHDKCLKKLFNTKRPPKVDFSAQEVEAIALKDINEKRGIPGVQRKLSLALTNHQSATKRLTIVGYMGGEYIFKPPTDEYPQMPETEDLTMHLASVFGILVAPHGLIPFGEDQLAYITKRFDRIGKQKLAVEDCCQLSLKLTEEKYRSSTEKLGKVIKHYSSNPGDDGLRLFELIVFSYIVGNADMHLKNFSMITEPPDRTRLSPFYDLLSTKILIPEHIDKEALALPVNGKKHNIQRKDFKALAQNLVIPDKVADYTLSKATDCWPKWEAFILKSFLDDEHKQQITDIITRNIHTLER